MIRLQGGGLVVRGGFAALIAWATPWATEATAAQATVSSSAKAVVQIGEVEVTAGQLQRRFFALSVQQRRQFGSTRAEQHLQFLKRVLIPEIQRASYLKRAPALLQAEDVGGRRGVRSRRVLASALSAAVTRSPPPAAGLDVSQIYAANQRFFIQPEAFHLWRILVASEARALALLLELKSGQGRTWQRMAREDSLDEATSMRSGDLGYVAKNGHTHRPQVRVNAALYAAAAAGAAGVLPKPVSEGLFYAVVWRKETRPAASESLSTVEASIVPLIDAQQGRKAQEALVAELREKGVTEYEFGSIESFDFARPQQRRPLASQPTPPARGGRVGKRLGHGVPTLSQRGLR